MSVPKPKVIDNLTAFKPENEVKITDYFKASSNAPGSALKIPGSFDTYKNERIQDVDGFTEAKSLEAFDTSTPKGKAVGEAIANALKFTPKTEAAHIEFNENLKALNQIISADPPTHRPGGIVSYLHKVKSGIITNLKAQQDHEVQEIETLFQDANFRADLKDSLKLESDKQVDGVKEDMIANLTKSHQEETTKVEKAINNSITKLHNFAKDEHQRLFTLGYFFAHDEKMRKDMLRAAAEREENQKSVASLTIDGDNGLAFLKGIEIKDLNVFNTMNGVPVNRKRGINPITGKEEDTYVLELNTLFKTKTGKYEDLTSLAKIIRASGATSIEMEVNCKDPAKAEEMARLAFESAIVAGFAPDKISIKVNGAMKYHKDDKGKIDDKLFAEHPTRLQVAKDKATSIRTRTEAQLGLALKGEQATKSAEEIQAAVQKIVKAAATATPPPSTPDPTSSSGLGH